MPESRGWILTWQSGSAPPYRPTARDRRSGRGRPRPGASGRRSQAIRPGRSRPRPRSSSPYPQGRRRTQSAVRAASRQRRDHLERASRREIGGEQRTRLTECACAHAGGDTALRRARFSAEAAAGADQHEPADDVGVLGGELLGDAAAGRHPEYIHRALKSQRAARLRARRPRRTSSPRRPCRDDGSCRRPAGPAPIASPPPHDFLASGQARHRPAAQGPASTTNGGPAPATQTRVVAEQLLADLHLSPPG